MNITIPGDMVDITIAAEPRKDIKLALHNESEVMRTELSGNDAREIINTLMDALEVMYGGGIVGV